MRLWQNLLALAATILAAGSLLPVAPRLRVSSALLAVALIVGVMVARLRDRRAKHSAAAVEDAYARIARIRAQRRGSRPRR